MNTNQDILAIFIDCIQKSGMTEKECLLASDVNTSFLTDWKNGKMKNPSYDKIVRLANYLNIDLNFLFMGKQSTNADIKLLDLVKDLSPEEREYLGRFMELSDTDKARIMERIDAMLESYPREAKDVG